ncbi:hypothetical protein ACFL2V_16550 [Pseudomonadota bacterium]
MDLPTHNLGDELQIRYWHKFSYSTYDYGQTQIQVWDDVSQTWGSWISIGNSFTGVSQGWVPMVIDVSAYAGETVRLGFLHAADSNCGACATESSGWFIDNIQIMAVTPNFTGGFETGWHDWWPTKGIWQVGEDSNVCYGGTQCAATQFNGNYDRWQDSRLVSAQMDFPAQGMGEEVQLRFRHKFSYSTYDYGQAQIQVWDDVSQAWGSWTPIGNSYTGVSQGWVPMIIDVSDYSGETVRLGFLHAADSNCGACATESSGWFIDDIQIMAVTPSFSGDFESGWHDWWPTKGIWQVGEDSNVCYSGTQCAATQLNGNYDRWQDSRLVSARMDTPALGIGEELQLRFQHSFVYSSFDSGQVQIQVWDDVNQTWGVWEPIGDSVAGNSQGWVPMVIDVSAYAGESVRLGFLHAADSNCGACATESSGWFIDDIQVILF